MFDGLKVAKNNKMLCEKWMNQCPVIFLSFKDVDGRTFENAFELLKFTIAQFCDAHALLLFIVLLQNPLTTEGASKAGKFCRDSSILIYGLHPLVLEAIARRIDVTLPETMLWAITIIVLCIVNIVWTKLWKMRS